MTKKSGKEDHRTYRAGKGSDGNEYGVTRMTGAEKRYRKKPCPTCPWRKDAEKGRFPAEAFRSSASTAYDASLTTFSCHEAGIKKHAVCAGFILANSENNMALRFAMARGDFDPRQVVNPENVELYESYRAMAIANGVDENDPRIAPCRGNYENGSEVFERMRSVGQQPTYDAEEILSRSLDEDHDDLMGSFPCKEEE